MNDKVEEVEKVSMAVLRCPSSPSQSSLTGYAINQLIAESQAQPRPCLSRTHVAKEAVSWQVCQ